MPAVSTTYEGRELLIERISMMRLMPAAERKTRFVLPGDDGLFDRSSRPHRTRTTRNALLRELKKKRLRRD